MKKRFLALTLIALFLLPTAAQSAEIVPSFPALYESTGLTLDYAAPISRAAFSMLTFDCFRILNGGVFPQMEVANTFADVGENPEDMFVVMLYGLGVVNGVAEGAFAPRRAVTREEACTMLTRMALRQNPTIMPEIENASLEGIADAMSVNDWAKESVAYLYSKNLLSLKDGKLLPGEPLSTEEAMQLCSAFIGA